MFCQRTFVLSMVVVSLQFKVTFCGKAYEHHHLSLGLERNRLSEFEYRFVETKSPTSDAFPYKEDHEVKAGILRGVKKFHQNGSCTHKLTLDLLKFDPPHVAVCLFKEHDWDDVHDFDVEIHGAKKVHYEVTQFHEFVKPVTGYVLGQDAGLVTGHIIDLGFYGQIRLLDRHRNFMVIFYIEPVKNAKLYFHSQETASQIEERKATEMPGANAILFEYVAHSEKEKRLPPPPWAKTRPPVIHSTTKPRPPRKPFFRSTKVPGKSRPNVIRSTTKPKKEELPLIKSTTKPKKEISGPIRSTVSAKREREQLIKSTAKTQKKRKPWFKSTKGVAQPRKDLFKSTAKPGKSKDPQGVIRSTPKTADKVEKKGWFRSTARAKQNKGKRKFIKSTKSLEKKRSRANDKDKHVFSTPVPAGGKRRKRELSKFQKKWTTTSFMTIPLLAFMNGTRIIERAPTINEMGKAMEGSLQRDFNAENETRRANRRIIWEKFKGKSRQRRNAWWANFKAKRNVFKKTRLLNRAALWRKYKIDATFALKTTPNPNQLSERTTSTLRQRVKREAEGVAIDDDNDIAAEIKYLVRSKKKRAEIYNLMRKGGFLCKLCIWMEPEFAIMHGFQKLPQYGVAEVIDLIRTVNWVFRSMDFNGDFWSENLGFGIIKIIVSQIPDVDEISEREWMVNPGKILRQVVKGIGPLFHTKPCCVLLAFVYRNMSPFGSVTYRRGMCVAGKNVAVISGGIHGHKVAKYDVYRFLMHALGHLMGAFNDDDSDPDCRDAYPAPFLDPYVMDPVHQINIGFRTNSMRFSFCSRVKIAAFLASSFSSCLEPSPGPFCGNGIVEDMEECDCGSPWQCTYQSHSCCGVKDSFSACKVIDTVPKGICHGPIVRDEDEDDENFIT